MNIMPLIENNPKDLLLGGVWNIGMGNENQESLSILISNGMESII